MFCQRPFQRDDEETSAVGEAGSRRMVLPVSEAATASLRPGVSRSEGSVMLIIHLLTRKPATKRWERDRWRDERLRPPRLRVHPASTPRHQTQHNALAVLMTVLGAGKNTG